jgi:hypothetical protein
MKPQLIYYQFLFFNLMFAVLSAQDKTSSSQLFDAKYKIVKHSVVHKDTTIFKLTADHPIKIVRSNGDSIFFELKHDGELDTKKVKGSVSEVTLLKEIETQKKMFFLLSEGTDKVKFTDYDVSPLVIPLKIRPALAGNSLQFTGDVSIGPYFGYQRGSKTYDFESQVMQTTFTICVFTSPSIIKINDANASLSNDASNNLVGLSAGGGLLLDLNNIQFGLVSGLDWISGLASKSWSYQGKPWYAFTFAYNLSNK